ncbi:MAG: 50S ribosomal protein L13 [Candidatus Uhrbacteria bacterium]|nr:50S ribosomal protein L13 [Candidatus Uhrbacteria bacterium]
MAWKNTRGMAAIKRETVTIDATGKVVGRLATEIAHKLLGKDQPGYTPHIDTGAIVTVTNVDKIVLTGKKEEQKVHFRSSNRPSGIKRIPVSKLMQENPGEVLIHAVKYMLPKNRTQKERMKRLIIA